MERLLLLSLLALGLTGCPAPLLPMDGLDVQVVPVAATTDDDLTATIVAHTFAFEEEGFYYEYVWTVDGAPGPPDLGREVSAALTLPDEVWEVTVTPFQQLEDELRTGEAAVGSVTIATDEEVL